jgi:hypothetical protein
VVLGVRVCRVGDACRDVDAARGGAIGQGNAKLRRHVPWMITADMHKVLAAKCKTEWDSSERLVEHSNEPKSGCSPFLSGLP